MAAEVVLRAVTADDVQFLYDLLAARPSVANISHREMPTMSEHRRFVLSHPYEAWYIIIYSSLAGCCYLTRDGEIGVQILPEHHRRGVGSHAIRKMMKLHPRKRFLANIAPNNSASASMFHRLGFEPIQHTYEYRP